MRSVVKHFLVLAVPVLIGTGCATGDTIGGRTTTTLPAAGGGQVVITSPARGVVRHSIVGTVTDIDRGASKLTVKMPDGSKMDLKLPPVALASVRDGDRVSLDVTVNPGP